jgi:hypothetical protein
MATTAFVGAVAAEVFAAAATTEGHLFFRGRPHPALVRAYASERATEECTKFTGFLHVLHRADNVAGKALFGGSPAADSRAGDWLKCLHFALRAQSPARCLHDDWRRASPHGEHWQQTVGVLLRDCARRSLAGTETNVCAEIWAMLAAPNATRGFDACLAALPVELQLDISTAVARRVVRAMAASATAAFKGGSTPPTSHFALYYLTRGRLAFPLLHLLEGVDAPVARPPPALLQLWHAKTRRLPGPRSSM